MWLKVALSVGSDDYSTSHCLLIASLSLLGVGGKSDWWYSRAMYRWLTVGNCEWQVVKRRKVTANLSC